MKDYGSLTRHWLAVPFELFMLGAAAVTAAQGNWKYFAISLLTFSVSFIPLGIERWFRVKIPALFQVVYVAFIFASMFSGEVLGMYGRIWPWDDWMHFVSGLLIGLAIMMWLITVRRQCQLPLWFEVLSIFCLNAAIEVMWEVIEFASDQLFGTFSQGADLADTMMDLVYGLLGGLIMAVLWVLYSKRKRVFVVGRLLDRFVQLNAGKNSR